MAPDLLESHRLLERAQRVDASFMARPGILSELSPTYDAPTFAERASGAYVWDVDGHRYIDYILGFGSVILGHADVRVTSAVQKELASDLAPTLHKRVQVEVCELLVQTVPNSEMALILRTGSDATDVAVRLARAFTGRRGVLRWGYHGWHDWCAERTQGIAFDHRIVAERFPYGDLSAMSSIMSSRGAHIACIVMMPYEIDVPSPGYLAGVRQLAHRHGALFILDEVRSGFRLALGGAQEYFGVTADLVAVSKAMANGYAISAVVGRRDVMRVVSRLSTSSASFRHTESMAAAISTIGILAEGNTLPRVWLRGRELMEGLTAAANISGLRCAVKGLPPTPFLEFNLGDDTLNRRAAICFTAEALLRGILIHPSHHWFLCAALTSEDVAQTVQALGEALLATAARL